MRHGNPPSETRSAVRFVSWCVLGVLFVLVAIVIGGDRAHAADTGIPFIDVCAKDAPYPALPTQGLPGLVGERPLKITNDSSPEHIWSTGGFGGLQAHPYDLGCALDPTSWAKITSANTDATVSNGMAGVGQTVTSVTDSMDRRAWQPGYVLSFMKSFMDRALGTVELKILGPFIGVGILATAIMVLWRQRSGEVSAAAHNLGWVLFVLIVTSAILLSPLALASWTQRAGNAVTGAMNNNVNASDGATNAVVEAVHYQGWLRRTFGSADSDIAKQYGPAILASQRFTWTEFDTANRLKGKARGTYIDSLVKQKSTAFKDAAAHVKEEGPTEYRHLTGQEPGSSVTVLELLFAGGSSAFRAVVDLLVVICVMMLVILGGLWVVATPWLVTPKGEQMGRGLIDNGIKAIVYVGQAALCAWGFTVFLQATMAPGMSAWWSLLLLLMGMSIFWIMLAPFHKMGSIISLGKMNGSGMLMKAIKAAALGYLTGRVAGAAAAKEVIEEQPKQSEDAPAVQPRHEVVHATIFSPAQPTPMDTSTFTEVHPHADRTLPTAAPAALPTGEPYYQRDEATPPPEDATTAPDEVFEPYQRTDDNEGASDARA